MSRAEIPFIDQKVLLDGKTVRLTIDNEIMMARGDKLEITFSDVVGVFITRIVRELNMEEGK